MDIKPTKQKKTTTSGMILWTFLKLSILYLNLTLLTNIMFLFSKNKLGN